jgi:CubicO group peptidase (beta-lactamase class C family)
MKSLRCLCFIVPLFCSAAAQAQGPDDRFAGLDAYVREAMQKWQVPGLAIAAIKDDRLVLARGYGVCEIGGHRPVTENSIFSIASCTKSFTAACLGLLVDEGKIQWDDPVRRHWPAFAVADERVSREATLRDLLCHRTGLVRGDLLSVKGDFTNDEILHHLRFLEQAAPFRTKVHYNNLMFEVLGRVVERHAGRPWDEFVAERFFQPLEMSSTFITSDKVPPDRLAKRHRPYDGRMLPLQKRYPDELVMPAGAIHSSVVDMTRWLSLHLNEGDHRGRRLLQADAIRDMHSLIQSIPIRRRPDANIYRANMVGSGMGWFVRDYRGRKIVEHGGGWGAYMLLVPEENLAVVALSNLDWNLLVSMLCYDVIDAYVVGPHRAWTKADKWDFWLDVGDAAKMANPRDEQRAQLEKERRADTQPTLPLAAFAGRYESALYGDLMIEHRADKLHATFGQHSGDLEHWHDDAFYGRSIVEPFLDWLVKFDVTADKKIQSLEVISVGWRDPDEKHIFRRQP